MNNSEQLNLLLIKLENLLLRQQSFEGEIENLRNEVRFLQSGGVNPVPPAPLVEPQSQPAASIPQKNTPPTFANQPGAFPNTGSQAFHHGQQQFTPTPQFAERFKRPNVGKSDFEKFIGENLISKIGILILIIGVGIGAKYAIDNGLISPLTRIVLGYLVGVGLMGFAVKLKAKYTDFSAVLVSGAIAILYFITYAAYDFYQLIPQALAFVLMVGITSFTIIAALNYNKQVIAHIGLVGAYAVPFLLSDGSGQVAVLFSYIAIINIGILVLAFKKNWKPLFYASFGLTWIIFMSWRLNLPTNENHFALALLFSTVFFLTFYITNLAYKISKKEVFGLSDVVIILLNSFVFYAVGYLILSENKNGVELLGLFTLANAVVHFVVSLIIYKKELADRNLFYLILALVITFITMAVPVQLNGGWVTIFWSAEAAVLLYLARARGIKIYEKLSFPLIFLAFISLVQDWTTIYDIYFGSDPVSPILNIGFLTAIIFLVCFGWMYTINRKYNTPSSDGDWMRKILDYALPSLFLLVLYITFRLEITKHFNNLFEQTSIRSNSKTNYGIDQYNYNYQALNTAWIYIYTLFFATLLTVVNIKKLKNTELAITNLVINGVVIVAFLTHGLYVLSELRESYLYDSSQYFAISPANIGIRYLSLAFFVILLNQSYRLIQSDLLKRNFKTLFDYVLYITILWVLSSELINILRLSGLEDSYKLGLSIFWGVYSLFLIGIGLWKNKKHLRIGAMVLFGITLVKLFVYDISYLSTIAKTIVFVSLGVLLLIISFLYNKYKHLIIDDAEVKN